MPGRPGEFNFLHHLRLCYYTPLKDGHMEDTESPTCMICLDSNEEVSSFTFECGCRADLHTTCLAKWHLERKDVCPVCRTCWCCQGVAVDTPQPPLAQGVGQRPQPQPQPPLAQGVGQRPQPQPPLAQGVGQRPQPQPPPEEASDSHLDGVRRCVIGTILGFLLVGLVLGILQSAKGI